MRTKFKLVIVSVLLLSLLTACQQDEKEYNELIYRLENLEEAYNQLLIETEEWLQLSDLEREFLVEKLYANETVEENPSQENIIALGDDNLEGYIS